MNVVRGTINGRDTICVTDGDGHLWLKMPMDSDSPIRPVLSATNKRPWFYTGSPYGFHIIALAQDCGVVINKR